MTIGSLGGLLGTREEGQSQELHYREGRKREEVIHFLPL